MEIIIQPNAQAAAASAARYVARVLKEKPEGVLGLATGSTPLPLYETLIGMHQAKELDLSRITTFNLDEYVGLAGDHPASYCHFMHEHFFQHLPIEAARIHIPDGMARDIPSACAAYEDAIREAGGIDIQVLGIGSDGHIGFNEPSSSLVSRTRLKTLTERTVSDNAIYFQPGETVPRHVLTMGVGTIMDCRRIAMLAFGDAKAEAVAGMVEGPVTASVPASILQMHQECKVFLDEKAAARLERIDYYKWVYNSKPDWQRF